jgi:hypothetical protein
VRIRVRSRNCRTGLGGIKLARSSPYCKIFSDSPGINPVRFLTAQRPNRGRIDQHQFQLPLLPLQDIPDRDPVHAGGFHRHLLHFTFLQPFAQPFQILCERPENSFFDLRFPPTRSAQTDAHADRFFVYVYPRATAI